MVVAPTQLKRIYSLLNLPSEVQVFSADNPRPQPDVSGIVEFLAANANTIGGWTDLVAEMDDLQIRRLVALCNLELDERKEKAQKAG